MVNAKFLIPEFPSVRVTSLTVMFCVVDESSLVIVPTPWLSVIVHPTQFDKLTVNVSFGSTAVSPTTGTVTVWVSEPPAGRFRVVSGIAV